MTSNAATELEPLERLAREYRVLTRYRDGFKRSRTPPAETLTAVLRALGAPIEDPAQAPAALREARLTKWSRLLQPCAAHWEGEPPWVELRLPEELAGRMAECSLTLEGGGSRRWTARLDSLPVQARAVVEGRRFRVARLGLGDRLPFGYHRLSVTLGGRTAEASILAAPRRCHRRPNRKTWGVFLPLYAVRTPEGDGVGNFSALDDLLAWARSFGGETVGTLPLLAAYLDQPFEYSPYAPVSRLFWNELYVDPKRTPEWESSPEARQSLESARPTQESIREAELLDYRVLASSRRRVLETLSQAAWKNPERAAALDTWVDARPELRAYARFRATVERRGETWRSWPRRLRDGRLQPSDYHAAAERYHLYAQWAADDQLAKLRSLYLDLPLGVHSGGFDVWRQPRSFAKGVSGGAPPDRFFTQGQNWSFAPLHPEAVRLGGHEHFRACLQHHLAHASILRVDHFMGLHRLYWIPEGASAADGTYIQYPAEELYAVLCIESRRAEASIVGEDLGTVPKYVRRRMRKRAIDRMYVAQFSFKPARKPPLEEPPADCLAGVNTHDTPTFAAFWEGRDIDLQLELRLLNRQEAAEAHEKRRAAREKIAAAFGVEADAQSSLAAILQFLAESPARSLLINLEDLWREVDPQNTPGTGQERPNWRRRARLNLAEIESSESIRAMLHNIDAARRMAGAPSRD